MFRSPISVRKLRSSDLGRSKSSFQSPERTARCGRGPTTRPNGPRNSRGGGLRQEEALLAKAGVAVGLQIGDDLGGGSVGETEPAFSGQVMKDLD